jgi:hypothetical protein
MRTISGKTAILIVGAIVVALSCVIFVVSKSMYVPVYQVSFGFLVLAEAFLFGGLLYTASNATAEKVFSASGLTVMSVIYLIAAVVLAFVAGLFANRLTLFLLVEIVAVAIYAIVCIIVLAFSRRFALQDQALKDREVHKSDEPKRGGF